MFLGRYSIRPLFIIFTILCAVFFERCAEPENEQKNDNPSYTNTLGSESIGDGSTGSIEKYFYNFDDAISASFFRYGESRFNTSYDQYLSTYPYPPDS